MKYKVNVQFIKLMPYNQNVDMIVDAENSVDARKKVKKDIKKMHGFVENNEYIIKSSVRDKIVNKSTKNSYQEANDIVKKVKNIFIGKRESFIEIKELKSTYEVRGRYYTGEKSSEYDSIEHREYLRDLKQSERKIYDEKVRNLGYDGGVSLDFDVEGNLTFLVLIYIKK